MKNQSSAASLFRALLRLTLISFFLFFYANDTYAAPKTWTGNTSTAWATPTNWSGNTLPGAKDDITIPLRLRMPILSTGTYTVRSVTINNGARLTMSAGILSVIGGSVQISGTFIETGGTTYADRDFIVKSGGIFNQSGTGMVRLAKDVNTNPSGSLNINKGGSVNQSGGTMYVKDYTSSPGTFNQAGAPALFKLFQDWKPGSGSVFNSTSGTVEFAGNSKAADFVTGNTRQFTNIIVDAGVNPGFDRKTKQWWWWTGAGIYISGNFTNNNTALNVSSGATFIFNGAGAQYIYSAVTSASNATFGNLYIDKSGGSALLTSNANVSGMIYIRNGTFDLSTYTCNNRTGWGFLYIASKGTMRLAGNTGGQTGSNFPSGVFFIWIQSKSTVEYYGTAQTVFTTTYGNLVISAAGTKTAVGNLNIMNSFTLSTSTFIAGNYNHNVGEDWTMTSGVFNNTGNTFTFNGRGIQNITSTPTGFFNKITVNKPSSYANITTDITTTTLNFIKGVVKTSANKMIIPSGGTVTGAAQTTGWVNGNLQKYHGSTAGDNYEIGTVLDYSPLSLTFANLTAPGNLIACATNAAHPNINTSTIKTKNIVRYWTLTKPATGAVGYTTATITFNWVTRDNYTPLNTATLGVANYNAPLWYYPAMTGTSTPTSCTATGITRTGDFAVGEIVVCSNVSSFKYAATEFCTNGGNANVILNAGASTGTFTATPAGLSLKSNNGQIKLGASTPGTYTVTNTVGTGPCQSTSNATISITAAPSATIVYPASSYCPTGSDAIVTLTGTSGGTFSSTTGLIIDENSGDVDVANSNPGTYTVTYTLPAEAGCSAFTTTTPITITKANYATINYTEDAYCLNGGVASVKFEGTTGGTFSSSSGLSIDPTTGAVTLASCTPGSYLVKYSGAASNGCAAFSDTATITVLASSPATISYSGSPYCNSDSIGVVTLTGPATGTFSSTAGLVIDNITGEIDLRSSTPGTYTVTYSLGGCSTNTAVTINDDPAGTAIGYAGAPYCTSVNTPQAVTLTGVAGGVFSSSAGLSLNSSTGEIDPSASTAGAYTVKYDIAGGGCAAYSATIPVTITTAPSATIFYDQSPFCSSDPAPQFVTFTGTEGGTYSAASGLDLDPDTGEIIPASSTPGTYTVAYTIPAAGGCATLTATASVTVTPAPYAIISYPSGSYCKSVSGGIAVRRTGNASGTYSSTPGLTITPAGRITPSSSTPGTYTVTYTVPAGGGCSEFFATTSVTITAAPYATISYPGGPFCTTVTNTAVTQTGTPGGTYSSAPALEIDAATGAINPSLSQAGTYTVTYTIAGGGGCPSFSATASVTIVQGPSAAISYAGDPFCKSVTTASRVTRTGTINGVYSSTAGLSINSSTGDIRPSASTPGTYTVTYTIAASGPCPAYTTTTTVTITAAPSASISYPGTPFCTSVTTASVRLIGTAGGTYTSTAGLVIDGTTGTITPSQSTPGTYLVRYSFAASGGCAAYSAYAWVRITGLFASISYPANPFCNTVTTATVTRTGTTGGVYSSAPAGLSMNAAGTISPSASTAGTYTVSYALPASGGCPPYTATTTVTITAKPSGSINYPGTPYCSRGGTNASVTLSGTAGGVFSSSSGLSVDATTGVVEVDSSTPGSYTVNYYIAPTGGCTGLSVSAPITVDIHAVWNGNVSNNWNDPNNWSCGGVPSITSNAVIPAGRTNYPVIYPGVGIGTVNNITIGRGASITDSGSLLIAGIINNSGVINALAGKVEFASASAQTIPSALFYSKTIKDLVISNPVGVTLTGPLRVTGSVAFGNVNNSVFTTGDSLTLASVATSDASVKDITNGGVNSGNVISGLVTVERYMPPKRAYRFLTAPVNSTASIKANWMENSINPDRWTRANPFPGYGTNITGAGDMANGFDATQTHNPSMFTFSNLNQAWVPVANTGSVMSAGDAYRIIVRGDRNIDMNTNAPTPTPTTLRATGRLVTGDVTLTKPGGGAATGFANLSTSTNAYNFIANPYASAVDWLTVDKTDIGGTIYIFDPNVAGSGGRGGYVAFNTTIYNPVTGAMGVTSNPASVADNYIQSGQAFFVQTAGPNPSITFKETDKASLHRALFRHTGSADPNLFVRLLLPSQEGTSAAADGLKVFFGDAYNNSISAEDSYKLSNQDENIAIFRDGKYLSIEGRKPVMESDTIPIKIWQLTQRNYIMKVSFDKFADNVEAYLEDKFLHLTSPLSTQGETKIPIGITSDPASSAADRFKIVFRAYATLPLHLLGVKAIEENDGVDVLWTAESENNMDKYEVEKSADGQQFVIAGTVKAKTNPGPSSNYNWFDLVPFKGDNYYRIKSYDKSGVIKYSNIAKVRVIKGTSGITVFPNPVQGKVITMRFSNIKQGNYSVSIINNLGEKVYEGTIAHSRGSSNHSIEMNNLLPAGVYQLHISNGQDIENIRVLVK